MGVSFPSWSHVVGRSGTSFSGARAECPCSHEEPHTSVKRHQDRDARAISGTLLLDLAVPASARQSLKTRMRGQSRWRHTPELQPPVVFKENYSWDGNKITTL